MSTVPVRKALAGADSWGHTWPEDGAVTHVDYEQALVLLAIPDGGFSVADHALEPPPTDNPGDGAPDPDRALIVTATRRSPGRRASKP